MFFFKAHVSSNKIEESSNNLIDDTSRDDEAIKQEISLSQDNIEKENAFPVNDTGMIFYISYFLFNDKYLFRNSLT